MSAWLEGSIGGVTLLVGGSDPCRASMLDGARLKTARFAHLTSAADGTPYVQGMNTAGKNLAFGVHFHNVPLSVLDAVIAAVNTATDGSTSFNVTLADAIYSVNSNCVIDPRLGDGLWIDIPEQSRSDARAVKDVVMRFRTT